MDRPSRLELLVPARWPLAWRVWRDLLEARRRIERQPIEGLCRGWQAEAAGPSARHRPTDADLATLRCVRRWANFLLAALTGNRARRCLPRSMVLLRWAGRLGLDATLVVSINRADFTRDGHAWVELDGTPLFEPDDPRVRFAELLRLGGKEEAGCRILDAGGD